MSRYENPDTVTVAAAHRSRELDAEALILPEWADFSVLPMPGGPFEGRTLRIRPLAVRHVSTFTHRRASITILTETDF